MSIFEHEAPTHPTHPALAELRGGFDAVGEVPFSTLEVDELNEFLIEAYRAQQQIKGVLAKIVHESMNQQLAKRHGEHSLSVHIAGQVHGNSKSVASELAFARWLHRFPELHAALISGDVTVGHLNELRQLENKHPKASPHMERAQDFFVDAAITLQFPQWVDSVGYWFKALDPDGKLNDPTDPKYGTTITKLASGDVIVTMCMDPVTGEAYLTAVDAEEQKIFNAEADLEPIDKLTPKQRTQTAIMRLITRGFQKADGSFPEPMVQLVMSEKVAEDLLARAMGCIDPDTNGPMDFDPFDLPIDYDDVDGRCETLQGTPVHPMHALVPLLISKMRRLVIDEYGQATEEPKNAPTFRFFTKEQRQVLLALARGKCGIAGCNNPYAWLQMDHIQPHSKTGQTLLPNGQPLCQPHNKAKGDRE